MPFLDELQNLLRANSQMSELSDASAFIRRCDVIDLLESHLAALSIDDDTVDAARAGELRDEAIVLCQRLERANAAIVQRLREDIKTGRCRRGDLLRELRQYIASSEKHRAGSNNLEYDNLDVLVAGIFGIDRLPDEEIDETPPEMVPYQPTPARVVLDIIERIRPTPEDVFVDIGSGLGLVPILISLLSDARSVGMEMQPSYVRHAQSCAKCLNISNVRFVCADARLGDFSTGTLFYMYTPFKGAVLQQVLERLHTEGRRRDIRLCTYGPILSEVVGESWGHAFERSAIGDGPISVFNSRHG